MPAIPREVTAPQIIAREFVGGKLTRGSETLSPAMKLAREMAQADETNWKGLLKKGAETTPDNRDKMKSTIDQIGITRNADGTRNRTQEEEKRFEQAKKASELTDIFIREGYDGLDVAQQTLLREKVIGQLEARDEFKDALKTLTPKQQQEAAERILRDPQLRKLSNEELQGIFGNSRLQLTDTVELAEEQLTLARGRQKQITEDIGSLEQRISKTNTSLEQLDPTQANTSGKPANEFKNLEDSESQRLMDLPQKQQALARAEKNYEEAKGMHALTLQTAKRTGGNDSAVENSQKQLSEAREKRETAQKEYDDLNNKKQRLEAFRKRQKTLQDQQTQLEGDLRTKKTEAIASDQEVKRLERQLTEQIKPALELQEKELVKALEGAIDRAIDVHLEEQIQMRIDAMEQALPEAEKKIADEKATEEQKKKEQQEAREQAVLDDFFKARYIKNKPPYRLPDAITRRLRWVEKIPFAEKIPIINSLPGLTRRLHYRMYDRGQIESDFSDIVVGGVDAIVNQIYTPGTPLTPEQMAIRRGRVTKEVLRWHQQATGRLPSTNEQAMIIAEQPDMEMYIKEQVAENKIFQESIKRAMGATDEDLKDPLYAAKVKKSLLNGNNLMFLAMFGLSSLTLISEEKPQQRQ